MVFVQLSLGTFGIYLFHLLVKDLSITNVSCYLIYACVFIKTTHSALLFVKESFLSILTLVLGYKYMASLYHLF